MNRRDLSKRVEAINFDKPNIDIYKDFVRIARDFEGRFHNSCLVHLINNYVFTTAYEAYIEDLMLKRYHDFGLLGVKQFVDSFEPEEEVYYVDEFENLSCNLEEVWEALKEEFLKILKRKQR